LFACLALYVSGLALITAGNILGPERWWWSSLNLYLPQCIWALPGLALLAVSLRYARSRAWLFLLPLLWVAGPLMGFCWPRSQPSIDPAAGARLRVMTYNIKWAQRDLDAIMEEIAAEKPDLLLLQDTGQAMEQGLAKLLSGWHLRTYGQYVIASHLPLSGAEVRWISFPGGKHTCLRCRLQIGKRAVTLYDVHLITPRAGLQAIKHMENESLEEMQQNTSARLCQIGTLADYIHKEQGPILLAGDLNAPIQSLVCRSLLDARLTDAFAVAGRGYGYTYGHFLRPHISFLRLDHIFTSRHWQVLHCWTGGAAGSDHRPVIADLFLSETG
jgi:endonuclease/exonuclease/phosphatase (EEP) superfamily protein YafD